MRRLALIVLALAAAPFLAAGAAADGGNLLPNGGFEGSLSGWYSSSATLGLTSLAHGGSSAALVANNGGTSFTISTSPRPVSSATAGDVYTGSAWIRSDTPGKTVCLRLREWATSTLRLSAQDCTTSSTTWTSLTASLTVATSGDSLDLYLYESSAAAKDSFVVDDVALVNGTAPPPPPPADTTPPETTITSGPSGTVSSSAAQFSFTSSEAGSTFRCALDGAAASACSSPVSYSGLADGAHTFSVAAVDAAGNADPTPASATWTVSTAAPPPSTGDPVLVAAGDQHACDSAGRAAQTGQLAASFDAQFAILGDASGETGTADEYANCYDPAWGALKSRSHPAIGNHDWGTGTADGYFGYFGAAAGEPGKGWYSYDLGAWHIVVLSSYCGKVGGCGLGSPQVAWLKADLAAHANKCTLAYYHHPLFTSSQQPGYSGSPSGLFQTLYNYGADVVLNAHSHIYERFAPQDPSGNLNRTAGIREFIVGTGGGSLHAWTTTAKNSEVRRNDTWGVLQLTLHPTGYDWRFVPVAGQSFTDSGSDVCH